MVWQLLHTPVTAADAGPEKATTRAAAASTTVNVIIDLFMKNQPWIPRAGARGGKGSIVLGF